jgi:hypothetical protein
VMYQAMSQKHSPTNAINDWIGFELIFIDIVFIGLPLSHNTQHRGQVYGCSS